MTEATDAPQADGPFTREQAVQALIEQEQPAPEAAAPVEAAPEPEAEEEQPAEAQPAEGDDPPEEPVEAVEGELSDPDKPVIAPPESWDAEARAIFATLPVSAQKLIAERDAEAKRATSRVMTEASEARKRAEVEASGLAQYKATLDQLVPQAQRTFADKWANVDWVEWAREDPAAAQLGRFQYESEQAELARIQSAHQQAERIAFAKFLETENERLKEVAPALADPKEGPARRKAVADYLANQGIQPEQLQGISAREMAIAHKAMLWDQAQAKAQAATTAPAKPKTAPVKAVAPVAAAQPGNSQQREVQRLQNRFAQTRSREDAVALILAKGL
jgi:hypothetical protein